MPDIKTKSSGNSGAEDQFINLFCDAYGADKGQYVYLQYPTVDIYGKHRTIDFAFNSPDGKVAIEIDGNTWHQPGIVSTDKYNDDLLKQNSLVHDGWKVFRWTSEQLQRNPERVKDELITFIGFDPEFRSLDENMPQQLGSTIELMEHQEEALHNLAQMRDEQKSIALLFHATGTGKTITAASDAKSYGKRTLFIAHRRELVDQAMHAFSQVWPEVSIGRFEGPDREAGAFVVCGTIQSISQNLDCFQPDDFKYLIIDECHHGTAETYRRIMSFFKPEFTLGLTATPERTDGEDLLDLFKNIAHRLDIKTAVELDALVPVRCIRIKTNIDMRDVRINGFKYNAQDLESTIKIPERNQLIVDTYCEYADSKPSVVFCASVRHAEEITARFVKAGVDARCVSGHTSIKERKEVLHAYESGDLPVLCACDLLNEGWDSPHTELLFMARPTMSKTIYMQQLGRGMRKSPGKDFLMVFDFVDNANLFNMPYSLHRILGIEQYVPGGLVLGSKRSMKWDEDLFRKGIKPDVLVDYPIHITGYEPVELFNWQEKAQKMVSQVEFTQMVDVQSETIERYLRDGKLVPDLEVPVSSNRSFRFFERSTVKRYAEQFGWTLITKENIRELFLKMIDTMSMSYSYKPVFITAFLDNMDGTGTASLHDVAVSFAHFYEDRAAHGFPAERRKCIFTTGGYSVGDVEKLILRMPFRRFEDMHFMRHSKELGSIQFRKDLFQKLTEEDLTHVRSSSENALKRYFERT